MSEPVSLGWSEGCPVHELSVSLKCKMIIIQIFTSSIIIFYSNLQRLSKSEIKSSCLMSIWIQRLLHTKFWSNSNKNIICCNMTTQATRRPQWFLVISISEDWTWTRPGPYPRFIRKTLLYFFSNLSTDWLTSSLSLVSPHLTWLLNYLSPQADWLTDWLDHQIRQTVDWGLSSRLSPTPEPVIALLTAELSSYKYFHYFSTITSW